jgi:hypothetical protein
VSSALSITASKKTVPGSTALGGSKPVDKQPPRCGWELADELSRQSVTPNLIAMTSGSFQILHGLKVHITEFLQNRLWHNST